MTNGTTLDTLDVLQEYASIRRGEHSGWKGDPVRNSESFAFRVGQDFGRAAYDMCEDAERNIGDLSELTGLPPNSIKRFVSDCRRSACIQMYHEDTYAPVGKS